MESQKHEGKTSRLIDDVTKPKEVKFRASFCEENPRKVNIEESCGKKVHLQVSSHATNVVLDSTGKPLLRPKSPSAGQTRGGKVLARKGTPALLPKMEKILGKQLRC